MLAASTGFENEEGERVTHKLREERDCVLLQDILRKQTKVTVQRRLREGAAEKRPQSRKLGFF